VKIPDLCVYMYIYTYTPPCPMPTLPFTVQLRVRLRVMALVNQSECRTFTIYTKSVVKSAT